jgi:hypothetical protein
MSGKKPPIIPSTPLATPAPVVTPIDPTDPLTSKVKGLESDVAKMKAGILPSPNTKGNTLGNTLGNTEGNTLGNTLGNDSNKPKTWVTATPPYMLELLFALIIILGIFVFIWGCYEHNSIHQILLRNNIH